ncbi:tRNA pseudouridine(55) synthase TruB [Inhella gelatinilytica]|uniref:tRNA pseudouridine synthase B n=1 Tax=Inhella gelatinilytica TaxID=2795030 RepID=A0A931NC33_9BURK|nr:tRNA pseudouridine(55) synthase TruB [Inhella gelatinilytica]MBH9554253.1 tRNA pseudouridine(55) synthase TruB [Inhella gelatinilytica]
MDPCALTRTKRVRRALHGVLLLDKPLGLSSNDALQKVKRLLNAEKAGHTGTLDPLATGLLPLCFGAATKFSQLNLEADKAYVATLRLGQTTTTGDREGEIVSERAIAFTPEHLQGALQQLRGEIDQVPPMHSALKHEGKALYELARQGKTVEREPRRVTIHALELLSQTDETLQISVRCSKGTYIRTLAEDLGELLGCGAHLSALRRTHSGPLTLDRAITLAELELLDDAARLRHLLPPDLLLADCPLIRLGADDAGKLLAGIRRRTTLAPAARVRTFGPEPQAFLGSARIAGGELIPERLLSPIELQTLLAGPASLT